MRGGFWLAASVGGAMALLCGREALACPFCASAKAGNGYLIATLVLLALPFTALAGLVLWLRRSAKASLEPDRQKDHVTDTP